MFVNLDCEFYCLGALVLFLYEVKEEQKEQKDNNESTDVVTQNILYVFINVHNSGIVLSLFSFLGIF